MIVADGGFVDTNVFVYAYSTQNRKKTLIAQDLIGSLAKHNLLICSTQVLQEFYVTLTKQTEWRVEPSDVLQLLIKLSRWRIVIIDSNMVQAAAGLSVRSVISFWDALILVAANYAGATRLYTEDLNHGQKIFGVEVVNPFLACA